MQKNNKILALVIFSISGVGLLIYSFLPQFETTDFDRDSIIEISKGNTTSTTLNNSVVEDSLVDPDEDEVGIIDESEKLLQYNYSQDIGNIFESYLLIGSDERDSGGSLSRGFANGQRADVIILALNNIETNEVSLISFPRDLLVKNPCTDVIMRINSTYEKNSCGNQAENLSATIYNLTGILVDHFALFKFQGFEEIIDTLNGVEICLDRAQREGYSFELQSGCQVVSGEIALNWVVSRKTEVLVGEKIIDENGDDISTWENMEGVSDLYRVEKQQYIILTMLEKLKQFKSFTDLYSLINALESAFTIDEKLTLTKASEILWNYRNFDFETVNKLTVPTKPYETLDGKAVLLLTENFYEFIKSKNILD